MSEVKEIKSEVQEPVKNIVVYEVGCGTTEHYDLNSTTGQVTVQDLIHTQAIIELNTIMTIINSGEGAGSVAMYSKIKQALVVESMKNILNNDTNIDAKIKEELKEFFAIKDEQDVTAEAVAEEKCDCAECTCDK